MDVVLIPAYQPNKELIKVSRELSESGYGILIVDDGSGPLYKDIFDAVSDIATVIHMEKNGGKGAALKHGMSKITEFFPACKNFITVDADGQHLAQDVVKISEKLDKGATFVLSIRDFAGKIPFFSTLGNATSRIMYTIITSHYLKDNQSGLRGFSVEHIKWLLNVSGDKYDYEINVLLYADKQHIKMDYLPIHSIYIDGNKESHFNPFLDTVRIYARLFFSMRASLLSILLCEISIIVVSFILGYRFCSLTIPTIGVGCTALCFVWNHAIFRGFNYKDAGRCAIKAAVRFAYYTGVIEFLTNFNIKLPLAIVFDLLAIGMVLFKFYFYKILYRIRHKA